MSESVPLTSLNDRGSNLGEIVSRKRLILNII